MNNKKLTTFMLTGLGFLAGNSAFAGITVTGFNNFSLNGSPSTTKPTVNAAQDTLQLTTQSNTEANSAFYKVPQSISNFSTSFTYTDTNTGTPADGFTFALQNQGPGAYGGNGGNLGYTGISGSSAAVGFDIYNSSTSGFGTNGSTSGYTSTGSVNLRNGTPVQVNLAYSGTTLQETLTQGMNTFSTSYTTNLATVLGSQYAYIGLTGATGGFNAAQSISNFTFSSAGNPGGTGLNGSFYSVSTSSTYNGSPKTLADAQTYIAGHSATGTFTADSLNYTGSDTTMLKTFLGSDGASYSSADQILSTGILELKGYINITSSNPTFTTNTDDLGSITIGGQQIVTSNNNSATGTYTGALGLQPIDILYTNYQYGGNTGGAHLTITENGAAIPGSALYPASPAPEPAEVATLSMIGLGMGSLLLCARRKRVAA